MSEKDCIFCKIVKGKLPSKKVYESDQVIAFYDINPEAPVHVLVVPKKHLVTVNELTKEDSDLMTEMFLAVKQITTELGVDKSGYRLVINNGDDGGQLVRHVHIHILGGKKLGPKLLDKTE